MAEDMNCREIPGRAIPQDGMAKPSITRQRYAELVQLGLKASQELTAHGLQRNEYCEFGRIMERIMQLE